jgi:dephospho-CoA kinase
MMEHRTSLNDNQNASDIPKGKNNNLLIGVTGGVASGKSTVANIFREFGAHLIDFDVIARQIIEPHNPAWKDIVGYFGKKILLEDSNIDRRKLADIVFKNTGKRKKLEAFTHPRIHQEFEKMTHKILSNEPGAVIQVVIPLMIELNMQNRFHKLVVVYIPKESQIERLVNRDGISLPLAKKIIEAQMPINKKIQYADFVIHNEKSLDVTKKQVVKIWKTLKRLQKEMERNKNNDE